MKIVNYPELTDYRASLKERKTALLQAQALAEKQKDATGAAEIEEKLRAIDRLITMADMQSDSAFLNGFFEDMNTLRVVPGLYTDATSKTVLAGLGEAFKATPASLAAGKATSVAPPVVDVQPPLLPDAKAPETTEGPEVFDVEEMCETKEEMLIPKPRTEKELNTIFARILDQETITAKLLGNMVELLKAQPQFANKAEIDILLNLGVNEFEDMPKKADVLRFIDTNVYLPIIQEKNPVKSFYQLKRVFPKLPEERIITYVQGSLLPNLYFDENKEEKEAETAYVNKLRVLFNEKNLAKAAADDSTIKLIRLMDKDIISETFGPKQMVEEYWQILNPYREKKTTEKKEEAPIEVVEVEKTPVAPPTKITSDGKTVIVAQAGKQNPQAQNNNPKREVKQFSSKHKPQVIHTNQIPKKGPIEKLLEKKR